VMHSSLVHWLPSHASGLRTLPPVMRVIALSRFPEDGPGWPDGAWSIVLFFEQPPVEQVGRASMEARVAFAFEDAPQERLHAGARFGVYYGHVKIADVEVLD
jgi:hypothetical protein